ncbi:MAG: hypothetical protein ACREN8_09930 [Candidatus Dormibacteraceae bacterium]
MRLLADAHCETTTIPVQLHGLPKMEAVFATNAAIQVRPITAIDEASWSTDHPAAAGGVQRDHSRGCVKVE